MSAPERILIGTNNCELEVIGESEVQITNKKNTIVALVSVVRNTQRNLLDMVEVCKLNL